MTRTSIVAVCGSRVVIRSLCQSFSPARMWVRTEVQLATAAIGYVGIELGGREVGMPEQLLQGAEVGAALEQVRGERVAQQVRVHALRLEAGLAGEPAQDQEGAGSGERPALRVQEELGAVARVEVRPAAREVEPQRLAGGAADRHDALLAALAGAADEPLLEVDAALLEPDRLADAEAGAVEQLDERAVAERARRRAGGRLDQPLRLRPRPRPPPPARPLPPLRLRRRQRPRQPARALRQLERRRGVVAARAEQLLVPEERADGGDAARDGRRGEAGCALLRDPELQLLRRRRRGRVAEPRRQL